MLIKEVRALNDKDLLDALEDQKEALFNLRFQKAFNQLDDLTAMPRTRRDIARIMLVIREREIARQKEGK